MVEMKRNSDQWQSEIDQLRAKQTTNLARVEELRVQKRSLALEANLGNGEARKKLDRVNAELTAASYAADDLATAIMQAESELAAAKAREDSEAARERMRQAAELVPKIIERAKGYSDKLYGAAEAAREVTKLIDGVRDLVGDPTTKQSVGRLLGGVSQNPFELCAIHSGLKQFVSLRGEPAHSDRLVRLEENLEAALQSLLDQAKRYAEMSPQDRELVAELDREFTEHQKQG